MCGTFEYGLNAAAKEFDGKNKYIRITDIDDASREFLLSDISSPDICLDGMSKYLLSSGDIVFARTGASVGKTYIYRENDGIVYFAGFLIRAKVNQDNDAEFVFQSTLSPSYEKYIRITSQRSGQPGVNAQEYGEYDLFAPSKEEQQRIGRFLRGIDNLITLHQRQPFLHSTPVIYPIAQLITVFYTSSWEQRRFFELYERVSRKNDLTYGRNDIISVANMYFKPDSYITDDSYLLTYNIFELGDIAFEGNKSKNYAHGRFVENTIGNGIVSHVFDVFKPIMNPYDLLFWKYAINNERLMGSVLLRSTKASTMMTNLVATDFLQESFLVPTYPEQQKIGAFFQQLDHLITLHQRKGKAAVSGCFLNCSSIEKVRR